MPQTAARPKKTRTKKRDEKPPEPIWGAFPLTQLFILVGLILLFVGMFTSNPTRVLIGLGLGCLGGLEVAIREHFAGFRSHTTLLGGFIFVAITSAVYFGAQWKLWECLIVGAIVGAGAGWLLLQKFRSVSGGLSYRLR